MIVFVALYFLCTPNMVKRKAINISKTGPHFIYTQIVIKKIISGGFLKTSKAWGPLGIVPTRTNVRYATGMNFLKQKEQITLTHLSL